jgi:hypothetical protein
MSNASTIVSFDWKSHKTVTLIKQNIQQKWKDLEATTRTHTLQFLIKISIILILNQIDLAPWDKTYISVLTLWH